jgi:hypothetical protein
VLVGAGDISYCGSEHDVATTKLLGKIEGTVFTLGDNAYPDGTAAEYDHCYGPTWGKYKTRTKPSVGNHDYNTAGASGYFAYFGAKAGDPKEGYYSYDLGRWHIVALNSNCGFIPVAGCGGDSAKGSAQLEWLKRDLTNNSARCTLAYFHHPRFTSGNYLPGLEQVTAFWRVLYNANADVILSAHDHNYQRFAPQDPNGTADPNRGIRQFVVGTGGAGLYAIKHPIKNTEVYSDETHGVLKLTLRQSGYSWRFVPVEGQEFTDSGSARCH